MTEKVLAQLDPDMLVAFGVVTPGARGALSALKPFESAFTMDAALRRLLQAGLLDSAGKCVSRMQPVIETLAAPRAMLNVDYFGRGERGITIYYSDQALPVAVMWEVNEEADMLTLESPPAMQQVFSRLPNPVQASVPAFSADLRQEESKCLAVLLDLQIQAMLAEMSIHGESVQNIAPTRATLEAIQGGWALVSASEAVPGWLITSLLTCILPLDTPPQADLQAVLNDLARRSLISQVDGGWRLREDIASWANHTLMFLESALLTLLHDELEWDSRAESLLCVVNEQVELVLARQENGIIRFNPCTVEGLHARVEALLRKKPAALLA